MKKKDESKKTKSAQELKADSMENVSGGRIEQNESTKMWEVYDNDTNEFLKEFESSNDAYEYNHGYHCKKYYGDEGY